ncbi:MAG: DNA-binding response regulator [Acidobacteria bacterium]|nr:MAG: DNA-binding response regulator [Acidobacteriota bacterium]REK06382.1 MAG: DNA-binding response regulator [Acidobacteriota bacterium]
MIRILIAEDQGLVLGALAALLEIEPDIAVVGRAEDGRRALEQALELRPDLVLTDIEMPEMTGLELATAVRQQLPESKVVIVTTFARPGYLRRALEAGASGYLLKDSPAEELAEALRRVVAGGRAIDPELAQEAWTTADPLSDRERQVLRLAGEGLSTARIAERVHLSEGTVRNYLSEAIQKIGAENRAEAARIAGVKGWL